MNNQSTQDLTGLRGAHASAAAAAAEEGSELAQRIARGGCAEAYYALEVCMGERDRAWTACQPQVRALRRCRDDIAAAERPQQPNAASAVAAAPLPLSSPAASNAKAQR